jgi:DNA-binding response OmpR family regulator
MGAKHISQAGDSDNPPLAREANLPQRILVVDDEAHIRQFVAEGLMQSGYAVDVAVDGAAAWDALCDDIFYDLTILDNKMPKLTGVELLQKLRAARMIVPVIMITGTVPQEEFARSPWLRPAATLVKPFTVEELLATVKEVLRANDNPREQLTSPPNRPSQPPVIRLQL